jgi:uncharacterized protein
MASRRTTFLDSVIGFAGALRRLGVPISIGEALDAAEALSQIDLLDRELVRTSLCATLVKREDQLPLFADVFATWFRARQHEVEGDFDAAGTAYPADGGSDPLAGLLDALRAGNLVALRAAAAAAVGQFGGLDAERLSSDRHHLVRVLRSLDLTRLLQRAMAEDGRAVADADDLAMLREHTAEFRRMLADEIRALLADRAPQLRSPPATDIGEVDFLQASPLQLRAMQDAIRPLARRLATRLARRRQLQHRGRIDVRRTARRALASGGVPIDPVFRRPRVHHPDLFVLCDLSGSVAEFAKFTITFLHALYRELPRTRLFVFVDGVDEVTKLIDQLPATLEVRHLLTATEAVGPDGHSDYGAALQRFWARYGDDLSGAATVIVAGDGRTNYRDAGISVLRLMHERVHRLYWLNPEPRGDWGRADSGIDAYRQYCDGLFEVRNLRQLGEFVYQLA